MDDAGVVSTRFWADRPVLVTGATGLMGAWLTRALVAAGADVVALVRDWVPQSELVTSGLFARVRIARGDVRDAEAVERVLGEYEVDTVFHLAAQTIVRIANANPVSTLDTNIRGTWTVLEACRRSPRVKQIILASSDKAYGDHEVLPYAETAPLMGRHPYDASKACADLLAQMYAATFEQRVAITRFGNLYGGGDLNWNRIVPGTIRSVLRNERPIVRSDGSFVRDYFYVEDGAAAYMLLAERLADDATLAGEAFNFSNESQVTVLELVDRILKVMGATTLAPVVLDEVSNEIVHQYLDATKARTRLGWRPKFELDEGLQRTVAWYESRLRGARA